jgi:hypothetical protein
MNAKHAAALLPLLVCCLLALAPKASPSRAAAQPAPEDIREIFLSVPYPSNVERGAATASYSFYKDEDFKLRFGTTQARQELLAHTEFGKRGNVLDTQGGYIVAGFDHQGDGGETGEGDPQFFILVTYFNMADGSWLVVLGFGDRNTPDGQPYTEDYFFTLAGGNYTQERAARFLPPLGFFADCWGDQPLPRPAIRSEMKGSAGITVEWPSKGTTAREVCYTPDIDVDAENLGAVYEKRQFDSVALVWDRQRGVFVKSEKTRHRPARGR